MTTFQQIQHMLAPDLELLNTRIAEALRSPNVLMNQVITNYLEKKGKQIRPIMVLLSARLLGEVNDKVLDGAVAVELLHNASLIHDDVVDDTKIRRGAATINGMWDNHLAVLVGDFFLSNALLEGVATGDIRMVESIATLGRLLSIGELDEIYNARYNALDENTYFEIIFRKTASLFVSCVEVGAYGAGSTATQLEALREFARLLGLCFQIKDDIFDYYEDKVIGKPTGNDLREGKITLPLIYAITHGEGSENERMRDLLLSEECLSSDSVHTLIEYAKTQGGIEYAYETMGRIRNEAVDLLSVFPPSETIDALIAILDYTIEREK